MNMDLLIKHLRDIAMLQNVSIITFQQDKSVKFVINSLSICDIKELQ